MDDTDSSRSSPEYADAIAEDMQWLGLNWDAFARQQDRFDSYELAKQKMLDSERLYACYDTPEELEVRRKMQISSGRPPIYDRAALKLSDEQKAAFEAEGRKPHYRFLLEDKEIKWTDMVRGDVKFAAVSMSDPVLIRADGIPLYTFASVVDDIEFGITHIVRGEDHVSNSAVQIQIFEALGAAAPEFAHLALLKTKEGEMSKRTGGNDIRALREAKILPIAINSYLAKIGTSAGIELEDDMDAIIKEFSFEKFGRAAANFDEEELKRLNGKLVQSMSYDDAKNFLPEKIEKDFFESVKANIHSFDEALDWYNVIHDAKPVIEDAEFIAAARDILPDGDYDESTFKTWADAVKEKTGRKGKDLFMPLRLALTGQSHGPEMGVIVKLLGRDEILKRLS